MSHTDVSCAAFALITDGQGRLAVLLNRKQTEKLGVRTFSPIGGALKVYGPGQRELLSRFRVRPGSTNDLRLNKLSRKQLAAFENWFRTTGQREQQVTRELWEELMTEFPLLDPNDLRYTTHKYLWYRRFDHEDKVRFVEVYSVTFEAAAMAKLLAAAEQPDADIAFVTEAEIVLGKADCGKLAHICHALLVD